MCHAYGCSECYTSTASYRITLHRPESSIRCDAMRCDAIPYNLLLSTPKYRNSNGNGSWKGRGNKSRHIYMTHSSNFNKDVRRSKIKAKSSQAAYKQKLSMLYYEYLPVYSQSHLRVLLLHQSIREWKDELAERALVPSRWCLKISTLLIYQWFHLLKVKVWLSAFMNVAKRGCLLFN